MTNIELVTKCKEIANTYKTLYVMGCIGAPMTTLNKSRYTQNHSYNRDPARTAMINAASADTFGFDCVCLIKSILWGWKGDVSATYGGAVYGSNNVPDIGADQMIKACSDVSADFSKIEIGEAVWMSGHIGVYIGDGLAVECTPAWENKVQITAVHNIGKKSGYNGRAWSKHGKLPYITYVKEEKPVFSDISGSVHRVAIENAYKLGIVGGYADGTFRPNDKITRGAVVAIVMRAFNVLLAEIERRCGNGRT